MVDIDEMLLGAGLHLGLDVPLSRSFSVCPLFMVGFHHLKQTSSFASLPTITATRLGPWIGGTIPLLYHPVDHFFVGVGPSVYQDFS